MNTFHHIPHIKHIYIFYIIINIEENIKYKKWFNLKTHVILNGELRDGLNVQVINVVEY